MRIRHFLHISYDGTDFHGWQRQSQVLSIQQAIEEALSILLRREIKIHGCGRTDAGVHALNYFAHCALTETIDFRLVYKINNLLPNSIVLHDIISAPDKANAQLNARIRSYVYKVCFAKNPLQMRFSTIIDPGERRLDLVNECIDLIRANKEFKRFCLKPDKQSSTTCNLEKIEWIEHADYAIIRFCGNRFLHSMIRILVHHLIEIYSGNEQEYRLLKSLLKGEDRKYQPALASAKGLILEDVHYDFLKNCNRKQMSWIIHY